jgi:phenylacetate-CoA ligase
MQLLPRRFNDHEANIILKAIKTKDGDFWENLKKKQSLNLFQHAAQKVPAYKDFLNKHKIPAGKIKTYEDLQFVPPVNKKNYLRQYPLEKLLWSGTFKNKHTVFTSTSGSTGEPFYFPREKQLDWESSLIHELFVTAVPHKINKPTLIIVGFGMGVWIGGLITYKAFEILSQRGGYPISIITTGINKAEVLKALRLLAPQFAQTILIGYPPFIKDILDEAKAGGINLKHLHLRILTAAEPYSEEFRDHIAETAGIKNIYLDTANVYGTADLGTMAYETPLSILVRRLAVKRPQLFIKIFSQISKTPTLTQYNPYNISFEAPGGNILITGNNTLPLVRYEVGDNGGVLSFEEISKILKEEKISLSHETQKAGLTQYAYKLPFVYVYERNDFSTTLYGLQIYPEIIREAILQKPLDKALTGKFAMLTKFDHNHKQYLEINLEMQKGMQPNHSLKKRALNHILSNLLHKSSEFKELFHHVKKRALPKLVFWPAEYPTFFKPGVKQKWTLNQ